MPVHTSLYTVFIMLAIRKPTTVAVIGAQRYVKTRFSPLLRQHNAAFASVSNSEEVVKPQSRLDPTTPTLSTFLNSNRVDNRTNSVNSIDSRRGSNIRSELAKKSLSFHIETYGCQMNVSDSEIVRSILIAAGHQHCDDHKEADIILTNTCAIRENAEMKVWNRLKYFQSIRKQRRAKGVRNNYPIVGVLGCMAERLKEKLLLEESVDFVCGPDAYRDVPRLVDSVVSADQKEANTRLSLEETYADIRPVREVDSMSAFVSIMRGCNNMCSFCIVPFTRGRERSREMKSIMDEVRSLSDSGVKEVVLLGQNVNGYHDISPESAELYPESKYKATDGFNNLYNSKKKQLPGARFPDLLLAIADINPEMRIRFTSPHPKDFPDEVLKAIAQRPNLCPSIHLPLQSGSSSVLQRMRRGYTREAYLELVAKARRMIPNVAISTDIITGFCGETEEEHQDTIALMNEVKFDQAFMFAYSLREKTHAAHNMSDDVPEEVKQRRLTEIIETYRSHLIRKNISDEYGQLRLVLVEGPSTKSTPEYPTFTGRTDGNKRVIFRATNVVDFSSLGSLPMLLCEAGSEILSVSDKLEGDPSELSRARKEIVNALQTNLLLIHDDERDRLVRKGLASAIDRLAVTEDQIGSGNELKLTRTSYPEEMIGNYVLVRIVKADTSRLRGFAIGKTTMTEFHKYKKILEMQA